MNEVMFFIQVGLVFAFTGILARFGKDVLAGWMGLLAIMANLFVSKQIVLFGLHVTASDVYAVGLFLSLNMIQELWGKEAGQKAIKTTLFFQIFFLALTQIHLAFVPSGFDDSQVAFLTILGAYPRILAASLFTLWAVQKIDLLFFSFLKDKFPKLSFSMRNILSLSLSQALDTILFTFLALWGSVSSLLDIIVLSYIIKIILIMMTPFITVYLKQILCFRAILKQS